MQNAQPAIMVENYSEPEDFLSDESFLAWYFKTGPDQGGHWEQWITAHPDRKELVSRAVELLNTTRIVEKEIPVLQAKRAEDALMRRINGLQGESLHSAEVRIPQEARIPQLPDESFPSAQARVITPFRWIAAASILALLITGLFLTRVFNSGKPAIKTQFGQILQQNLPDGTAVMMNANSNLSYSTGWKEGADREVWVKGEAFFHVTKTPQKSRFIVHTDHFDVVVTGTQFNVVNRNNKANVMLKEGTVIIYTKDGRTLHMAPGDFVEFNNTSQLEKRQVKNDSILAWKEQKLVFDKTPLLEIVNIIKEQYGVSVKLADDSVGLKTVSGILPNNNLDVLLRALEATSEFDVTKIQGEDTIMIKTHSQ
jgi:transmembrane sensor